MELIGKCFALTLLFITLLVTLTSAKPLILSAHEGDRVFIPCFNTPDAKINYWKISGSLYPVEELPSEMYLRKNSNGIIVHYTTLSIAGEFTCFTFEGRTTLREISTVNFVVQARGLLSATDYEEPEEHQTRTEETFRVTESDTIFIPCIPALGTNNVTIWGIDGSLYPFLELPLYHIHQRGGIIVYNVSRKNNASGVYQCYSTVKNILQKQFTIQLNFYEGQSEDDLSTSADFLTRRELELKLVSKGVSLNHDTTYDFEYRFVNASQTTTGFCIPGNLTSAMNVTKGTENLWRNDSILLLPKFSPPRQVFENNEYVYGKVYSTNSSGNECARLNHKIEVKIDGNITFDECTPEGNGVCCVQEGDQSCVPLPEDLSGLNVIWPRKHLSQQDCVCGVFLPSPLLPDLTFEDCYCLKQGLTIYNVTLIDKRLCWMNLTRDTNDTKIIFVRDIQEYPEVDSTVRTFVSETRITVEGLDPFPPMFTESSPSTVCINSTNPEWNPVQRTVTTVYDITGDLIQYTTDSNDFCKDFKDFPQSCAPFTINATAYTQCVKSPSATFNVTGNNVESSICECLKDKVNLTITLQEAESNSITLSFSTTCWRSPLYNVDNITDLYLNAVEKYCIENCTTTKKAFTIQCDQNSTSVTVHDLKELTFYNLWISPSSSSENCSLLNNEVIQNTGWSGWKIGMAAGTPGLIAVIVVVVVLIIAIYYHRRKKRQYDPSNKPELEQEPAKPPEAPKYLYESINK